MSSRARGTLDTSGRSKEEAPMVRVNWQGKPRDYALIVALVALEGVAALAFMPRADSRLAHLAYIDPGVGAMIVQALAAAFFGAIFYFKNLRKALARFFLKLTGKAPAPEQVPAEASSSPEKK